MKGVVVTFTGTGIARRNVIETHLTVFYAVEIPHASLFTAIIGEGPFRQSYGSLTLWNLRLSGAKTSRVIVLLTTAVLFALTDVMTDVTTTIMG